MLKQVSDRSSDKSTMEKLISRQEVHIQVIWGPVDFIMRLCLELFCFFIFSVRLTFCLTRCICFYLPHLLSVLTFVVCYLLQRQ